MPGSLQSPLIDLEAARHAMAAAEQFGEDGHDDPEALFRFQREAETVARLDHPNVVRVYSVAHDAQRPYLVMELIEGRSLAEVTREAGGRLPPRRAAELCLEVARGLAHAHGRRVLHRDVKPGNVLVDREGRARLTDFGLSLDLAEERERLTRTGAVLGTPTTDVYGLGATLYMTLTGRPPCVGGTLGETIVSIFQHRPPSPSSLAPVDSALSAICLRCLEKDPDARYPSADALADALEGYLSGPARWPPR